MSAAGPEKQRTHLLCPREEAIEKIRKQIRKGQRFAQFPCGSRIEVLTLQQAVDRWTDYNIQLMQSLFSDDSISETYRKFRGRVGGTPSSVEELESREATMILEQMNQLLSDAEKLELIPDKQDAESVKRGTKKAKNTVFIGHGRSYVWMELQRFLKDTLNLDVEEFNSESAAGLSFKERLQGMLKNADFAFIVMTAEDEHADGAMHARENVIHEAGLFQGKLGFEKAIILLEQGCTEFSNKQGLVHISFAKGNILAAGEEIRRVLAREQVISPS